VWRGGRGGELDVDLQDESLKLLGGGKYERELRR